MKLSKEARKGARALYGASFSNGRIDQAKVKKAIAEVSSRKPAGYGQILHEYHRLVRLEVERRTAVVVSAVDLAQGEREKIETAVRASLGEDVRANFTTEAALLGGVKIRVGSYVCESSIRDRLNRLRRALSR